MDKYQYRIEVVKFDERIAQAQHEADLAKSRVSQMKQQKARFELEVTEAWDKARLQAEAERLAKPAAS